MHTRFESGSINPAYWAWYQIACGDTLPPQLYAFRSSADPNMVFTRGILHDSRQSRPDCSGRLTTKITYATLSKLRTYRDLEHV